jgi:hypothetical protein
MKIAIKIMAASMMLAALAFSGCKKTAGPKGDTGAQGPQGPVVDMQNGGHITGTITGTRRDGTAFSEPFSYTYYFPGSASSGSLDSTGINSYNFNFQRQEADIFSNNNCSMYIMTTSKTATSGNMGFNLVFQKTLSASKLFNFSANPSSVISATGLSYNTSTGSFSGNFNISLTGSDNNTGNPATITGNFQVNVVQYVYKKQQLPMVKAD